MKNLVLTILLMLMVACTEDCSNPTQPDTPPRDPDPPSACQLQPHQCPSGQVDLEKCECVEPPFDPGVSFSWDINTRGLLSFPATQASETDIVFMHNRLKGAGWPTITWHTCTETVEWQGTPWADTDFGADSLENMENLERFLTTTARLGDQVLLDIFCTVRDNHGWMANNWERYTNLVIQKVLPYNHVAIHIANEPWHPRSFLRGVRSMTAPVAFNQGSWFFQRNDRLRAAKTVIRSAGFNGLVGADDNIGSPSTSFRYQYSFLDWTDFHPYRNPDPSLNALKRMRDENFGKVVISESTAYSTWRMSTCCTDSKQQIITYMNRTESLGMVWFFHSTDGLGRNGIPYTLDFEWVPGEP